MLFGYKVSIDDRIGTMVVAATTVEEFTKWCDENYDVVEGCFFNEVFIPGFLDAMTNDTFKGYKKPVRVFYHDDTANQDEFIKKHAIELVQPLAGPDKQADMIWLAEQEVKDEEKQTRKELFEAREKEINEIYKKWRADIEARKAALQARRDAGEEIPPEDEIPEEDLVFYLENEYAEKTIAEELELNEYDPWDRRSEEEKEHDRMIKEKIDKAKKAGKLSGESFGGPVERDKSMGKVDLRDPKKVDGDSANTDAAVAPEQVEGEDGEVFVTKISTSTDANGNITVHGINAIKKGGEVNEEEKAAKIAEREEAIAKAKGGKRVFTPEDFAKALRGDGRMDSTGGAVLEGDKKKVKDKNSGKKRPV